MGLHLGLESGLEMGLKFVLYMGGWLRIVCGKVSDGMGWNLGFNENFGVNLRLGLRLGFELVSDGFGINVRITSSGRIRDRFAVRV